MDIRSFTDLEAAVELSGDLEHDLMANTGLYYHAAVEASRASADVDQIKYELLCLEAELQESVRAAAATAGEKVTEALITARIKAHPDYTAKNLIYLAAQRKSGEWTALQRAYESRGHILHDLVLLATRGVDAASISSYGQLRQSAATARRQILKK